jgi:putative NADH-flavin reductase
MNRGGTTRLAVFGGTGRTGRLLLAQASTMGFEPVVLAREPSSLRGKEGITVIEGNALDKEAVARVVEGSAAVVSALGRDSGSPPNLMTMSAINIVAAMKRSGTERLIVLTNTAVEDPADDPPASHRLLRAMLPLVNGKLVNDSREAARVIAESELHWTLVRAPILTDGSRTGGYRVGPLAKGIPIRVSRADAADFMLSCLVDNRFVGGRPAIGGGKHSGDSGSSLKRAQVLLSLARL